MSNDNPITLENALKVDRPILGNDAPIALFRLIRLVALDEIVGRGASATYYHAGKKLGLSLGFTKVDQFLKLCTDLRIGQIEVIPQSDNQIHIDVHECVTCAGMDTVGRAICHFEGGLISGALKGILGRENRATEVSCIGGLGDKTCGFDVKFV